MARIDWTPQSLQDMISICTFISEDVPRYAQLFAQRVFDSVERLSSFPLSGRVVPEVGQQDIREIILGNYRIIYRVLKEKVQILTVYHSARLLDVAKLKSIQ